MKPLQGLYAITSEAICTSEQSLLAAVAAALRGGAALIQYRTKQQTPAVREQQARALALLCRRHAVPLIINDDPQLAAAAGADGVHLGRSDAPLAAARELLGPTAIIGVTCGDDIERAQQAAAAGANYVAFGRFYPSRTKPQAPPAPLSVLRQARQALPAPVAICAIGGILPAHVPELRAAGAQLFAAIEGIFGADDIEAAARAYTQALTRLD